MLGLGLGVAGQGRGWVVVRAGFWGVLATLVGGHPQVPRRPSSVCDSGVNLWLFIMVEKFGQRTMGCVFKVIVSAVKFLTIS